MEVKAKRVRRRFLPPPPDCSQEELLAHIDRLNNAKKVAARESAERVRHPDRKKECPVCKRRVGSAGSAWPAPHLDRTGKPCVAAEQTVRETNTPDMDVGLERGESDGE